MKTLIRRYVMGMALAIVVMAAGMAQAVIVNVDVSNAGEEYSGLGAAADDAANTTWTEMNGTANNLVASDGSATTIDVSVTSFAGSFHQGGGAGTGSDLMQDRLWVNKSTATITISGLETDTYYDIYLYGTYNSSLYLMNTEFTIDGITKTASGVTVPPTVSDGSGWKLNEHYVVFGRVRSSAAGVITGTYANSTNGTVGANDYGALSGIQIMPTSDALVNVDVQSSLGVTYSGLAAAPDTAANTNWSPWLGDAGEMMTASDGSASAISLSGSGFSSTAQPGPNDLVRDRFYTSGTSTGTVTISGLGAGRKYDIYLYSAYDSRTNIVDFATEFAIGGVTKTTSNSTEAPTVPLKVNVDVQANGGALAVGRAAAPDFSGNSLWNEMKTSSVTDLTASDGSATTVDVSISDEQGFTNQGGPNNVVKDRVYKHRTDGDGVFDFTISGLAAGKSHDIYLYGAYDSRANVNFATDFTIGGVTNTAQALTLEPSSLNGSGWIEGDHYVKFTVTSSAGGVITGTVANHDDNDPGTTGDYGILSAIQIVLPVDGSAGWTENDHYVLFSPVTASAAGEITVTATEGGAVGGNGIFSGMQIGVYVPPKGTVIIIK